MPRLRFVIILYLLVLWFIVFSVIDTVKINGIKNIVKNQIKYLQLGEIFLKALIKKDKNTIKSIPLIVIFNANRKNLIENWFNKSRSDNKFILPFFCPR